MNKRSRKIRDSRRRGSPRLPLLKCARYPLRVEGALLAFAARRSGISLTKGFKASDCGPTAIKELVKRQRFKILMTNKKQLSSDKLNGTKNNAGQKTSIANETPAKACT